MPGSKAPEEARREQILRAAYAVALRDGIDGVTVRAVAAEAGLSHGLVLFHFKRKDSLIDALLDRVLATTAMLEGSQDLAPVPGAPNRLSVLFRHELDRLAGDVGGSRLFFEYWALGVRRAEVREKIGAALARYRAAFRATAAEMLASEPARDGALTPDALAAVAVGLINGCLVQAMVDPDHFDTAAYLSAVDGIIERLGAAPA